MKRNIIIAIIAVLAVVVVSVIKFKGSSGTEVKAAKAERGELVITVSATCNVRSNNEAKLTTTGSGRVSKIYCDENQEVKKGDVLLELDTTEQFEKDYKRLLSLEQKGFVPSQQVELAKEQWKSSFITAPFSGTIVKKFVEIGEPLISGSSAFMLADLNDMIVEANIDETDIGRVKTGQSAEIVLDAYKDKVIKGKVIFIAKSSLELKEKGITYSVKVKLDSSNVILRLGMTGDINIRITSKKNVLMIPYTAMGEDKDGKYVFKIENNNKLKKTYIQTGLENYDSTEILKGLNENDSIVESNISKLKEKEKIKIKQAPKI